MAYAITGPVASERWVPVRLARASAPGPFSLEAWMAMWTGGTFPWRYGTALPLRDMPRSCLLVIF